MINLDNIPLQKPVLLAGPTASGKSALALSIAQKQGRTIVNADALQVYAPFRILTARPDLQDEATAPHALYGHVPYQESYSVGQWLRDLSPWLACVPAPVIVGGTGLYFTALTEGLVDIPLISEDIRSEAMALDPADLLQRLDASTRERIDQKNPMRIRRAYEVLRQTGQGLAWWQDQTPPPLLSVQDCFPYILMPDKMALWHRISKRFDRMIQQGALDEVRALCASWDPVLPASKAIGASELMATIKGEMALEDAIEAAKISTRQYAKRQRSWFRNRMKNWTRLS